MPDTPLDEPPPSLGESIARIASTLLAMMRVLGHIEERLMHLEALSGVAPAEYIADDREEYSQSVLQRTWDPVARRWVYSPEGE